MTELELLERSLALESAGPTCWRICDRRVPSGQSRFLAFVEQKGDVFEVMQLANDFIWTECHSLAAALEHVVRTRADAETARASTARGWLS